MYSGLIIPLGILFCIGILATTFATRLNRDRIELEELSRNVIRRRISRYPERSVSSFVLSCNLNPADGDKALLLLQEMGQLAGCSAGRLTFETTFGEVFRVSRNELEMSARSSGRIPTYFEPFTYDILHLLMRLSDKIAWEESYKAGLPRSEEELADFIMTLTPAQFLTHFAPIISADFITRKANVV